MKSAVAARLKPTVRAMVEEHLDDTLDDRLGDFLDDNLDDRITDGIHAQRGRLRRSLEGAKAAMRKNAHYETLTQENKMKFDRLLGSTVGEVTYTFNRSIAVGPLGLRVKALDKGDFSGTFSDTGMPRIFWHIWPNSAKAVPWQKIYVPPPADGEEDEG